MPSSKHKPPVLAFYDVKKPVTLTCDASKSGLGAACLQEGKPIANVSKALTDTQTHYAHTEKEMLAAVFTCKKFHDFIFDRKITAETDHQQMVSVFKKPPHPTLMRLQLMLLNLKGYDIDLVYKRGTQLHVADALPHT